MTDQTPPPPSGAPANLQKARLAQRFSALNPDALAKAEAALKGLSANFGKWLDNEITKLEAARAAIALNGMSSETADQLYVHAHDLKGLGATYGFPLITRVAGSLCTLMNDRPSRPMVPVPLIDAHLEVIRTIIRDDMRDPEHAVGMTLAAELEARVAAYAPTDAISSSTAP
jgi:hypothetical protein